MKRGFAFIVIGPTGTAGLFAVSIVEADGWRIAAIIDAGSIIQMPAREQYPVARERDGPADARGVGVAAILQAEILSGWGGS